MHSLAAAGVFHRPWGCWTKHAAFVPLFCSYGLKKAHGEWWLRPSSTALYVWFRHRQRRNFLLLSNATRNLLMGTCSMHKWIRSSAWCGHFFTKLGLVLRGQSPPDSSGQAIRDQVDMKEGWKKPRIYPPMRCLRRSKLVPVIAGVGTCSFVSS